MTEVSDLSGCPTSAPIDQLAAALVVALGELTDVPKGRTARVQMKSGGEYRYTYADLGDALEMVRPVLARHGLGVVQPVATGPKGVEVTTVIVHSSGQTMTFGPLSMSAGDTSPQATGSAITYARRYSLLAALGLATEEDDDGQAASARPAKPSSKPAAKAANSPNLGPLFAALNKAGITEPNRHLFASNVLGRDIGSFSELTKPDVDRLIEHANARGKAVAAHPVSDPAPDETGGDAAVVQFPTQTTADATWRERLEQVANGSKRAAFIAWCRANKVGSKVADMNDEQVRMAVLALDDEGQE